MNQSSYDRILGLVFDTGDEMLVTQFKKHWKQYNQYKGAVMYSRLPEIHIHYDSTNQTESDIS